jgi:hypothetical protein
MPVSVPIGELHEDPSNPRITEPSRMRLLRLSLGKMGFVLPLYALKTGFILSGHQRLNAAKALGFATVPVEYIDLTKEEIRGVNVIFNRLTNDMGAMETGSRVFKQLSLENLLEQAEKVPDFEGEDWPALHEHSIDIRNLGKKYSDKYDKKSVVVANNLLRKGIQMPLVVSESGDVVNGVHRLLSAREDGVEEWPAIVIPDEHAELAVNFLNYISMDYKVDGEFERVLRYSAYRRPQNNRGAVPKAYRFWANGERTLPDKDSYSLRYWRKFRDLHGHSIIDFGAGLGKVAPHLHEKGIDCIDFEPYRIPPDSDRKVPDSAYSRRKAKEFLQLIADGRRFDSIFLASVLNSVPFPMDRMAVIACVHGLCSPDTVVYGTLRDISDYNYEYSGIRQANYFVFDSEPGVRIGDVLSKPKIQKFHSQEEARDMFSPLWKTIDFWAGGNIFYFRLRHPKRVNPKVLAQALDIEFENLPFADGSVMGLGRRARKAYSTKLGITISEYKS